MQRKTGSPRSNADECEPALLTNAYLTDTPPIAVLTTCQHENLDHCNIGHLSMKERYHRVILPQSEFRSYSGSRTEADTRAMVLIYLVEHGWLTLEPLKSV